MASTKAAQSASCAVFFLAWVLIWHERQRVVTFPRSKGAPPW